MNTLQSNVQTVMNMSRENHWGFKYIGNLQPATNPFKFEEWEFTPLDENCIMPKRIQGRIDAVNFIMPVIQVVIAHDYHTTPSGLLEGSIRELLPEPKPEPKLKTEPVPESEIFIEDTKPSKNPLKIALSILRTVGTVLWWSLKVAGILGAIALIVGIGVVVWSVVESVGIGVTLGIAGVIGSLILILQVSDPVVFVVCKDGNRTHWFEVARWLE